MPHIRSIIRTGLTGVVLTVLSLAAPLAALADASSDCVPPSSTDPGVHKPVGADAGMYTYQCTGTYAGKWVSAYYVFDPADYSVTPLYSPDYSYDCTAKQWSKTEWDFSAPLSGYVSNRVAASDPGLPTGCPVSTPAASNPTTTTSAPASTPSTTGSDPAANSLSATGPNSTNTSEGTPSSNSLINNTANVTMDNTVTGAATSGNSLVLGNTVGGSAATGNATDLANVVNLLQSSSNALGAGSNVITFTKNIDGDVVGDLILDPSLLGTLQPANTASTGDGSLTVNNSTGAAINNDTTIGATSGNATVASNTQAGDATTGNATAIANVVNMINSILTAGNSFIGTININGNLDGDILLPPNFIDQLVASNTPTVTVNVPTSTNTTVSNTNNLGINNQVTTAAASGDANVTSNTSAGNATSGNATTKVMAFNLTGSHLIGQNAILVFVNVQGQWVGLIVNAPAGATAAELGGGVTANNITANTDVNNATTQQINNNINVAAKSGDANVTNNTEAGNATSGNAYAAVNLFNLENSSQSLAGWLGILFINVFGMWHGSFGINTSAGNPIATTAAPGALPASGGSGASAVIPVFRFVAHHASSGSGSQQDYYQAVPYTNSGSNGSSSSNSPSTAHAVLAASSVKPDQPSTQESRSNLAKKLAIIAGFTIGYIVLDAAYSRRKEASKASVA